MSDYEAILDEPAADELAEAAADVEAANADEGPIGLDDLLSEPDEDDGDEDASEEEPAPDPVPDPDDAIVVEPPRQREDGKWTHGKYVTNTLEELVVQIEKGRLNAEKLVGKKVVAENPFALPEAEVEDDDEFDDEVDDVEYLGQAIASALQASGAVPGQVQAPGVDPMVAQQAVNVATQVLQVATSATVEEELPTSDNFDQAIELVIAQAGQHPQAPQTLRSLLDTWGAIDPHKAALKEFQLQQRAQEEAAEVQRQQSLAELEAEESTATQVQTAFRTAQEAFATTRPDWVQRSAQMNDYFARNPALLQAAQGNAQAVYAVFETAYQLAGAGFGLPVAEQGGNMTDVNTDPANTVAAHAARAASARDLGGMETVLGDPGLGIKLTNPNPPGLDETPLADLLGIPTLND